jgi:hypothetical protein
MQDSNGKFAPLGRDRFLIIIPVVISATNLSGVMGHI